MFKHIKSFIYKFWLLYPYSLGKAKKYYIHDEKSLLKRFFDLLMWLFRDNFFNIHYYAWGLNIKGKKQKEFIGRKEFLSIKYKVENKLKKRLGDHKINYEIITKDKFYSNALFVANNIPCIPVLGLASSNEIIYPSGKTSPLSQLLDEKNPYVLKNTILEAGDGFLLCKPEKEAIIINGTSSDLNGFKKKLGDGKWILQAQIKSHDQISHINNSALNTTRIVTILNGKEPVYLTGFQSFATNNCKIDSWGKGAIYVGIDIEKNCLNQFGFYHPQVGKNSIVEKHPDSGVIFKDYIISDLNNAVKLCIKAHKLLYSTFIIGWDVAITENGPLIVEANEKPGMNAVQCLDGGLRSKIKQLSTKI